MANHCVVWCVITKWNLSDREFCIMLYVLNIWKVSLFLGSNLVKHSNCITRRDIISIWLHKHTRLFMLDWILRLASLILVKHLQFFPIMTEPRGIRALALWPRWPAPSVRAQLRRPQMIQQEPGRPSNSSSSLKRWGLKWIQTSRVWLS